MPELPEVETVKNTLKNLIVGKEINDIIIRYDKIIKYDLGEFKNILCGRRVMDIKRRGKYLMIIFDEYVLISHLRMEGKYFLKTIEDEYEKHEHIIFSFTDKSELRYHDTRKFGTMNLVKLGEEYTTEPLKKLGLEPLDEKLTVEYLRRKLKTAKPIKSALLDQTIIAGLGNIYVDEVLFIAKIHPEQPANSLSDIDIQNIIDASSVVIKKAIELGGTTIRSYTSSLGVTGRFQNELLVHGKAGEACPNCGSTIKKIRVGGRGTSYCDKCQVLK